MVRGTESMSLCTLWMEVLWAMMFSSAGGPSLAQPWGGERGASPGCTHTNAHTAPCWLEDCVHYADMHTNTQNHKSTLPPAVWRTVASYRHTHTLPPAVLEDCVHHADMHTNTQNHKSTLPPAVPEDCVSSCRHTHTAPCCLEDCGVIQTYTHTAPCCLGGLLCHTDTNTHTAPCCPGRTAHPVQGLHLQVLEQRSEQLDGVVRQDDRQDAKTLVPARRGTGNLTTVSKYIPIPPCKYI